MTRVRRTWKGVIVGPCNVGLEWKVGVGTHKGGRESGHVAFASGSEMGFRDLRLFGSRCTSLMRRAGACYSLLMIVVFLWYVNCWGIVLFWVFAWPIHCIPFSVSIQPKGIICNSKKKRNDCSMDFRTCTFSRARARDGFSISWLFSAVRINY